jgi:hypothetical protein
MWRRFTPRHEGGPQRGILPSVNYAAAQSRTINPSGHPSPVIPPALTKEGSGASRALAFSSAKRRTRRAEWDLLFLFFRRGTACCARIHTGKSRSMGDSTTLRIDVFQTTPHYPRIYLSALFPAATSAVNCVDCPRGTLNDSHFFPAFVAKCFARNTICPT